MRALCLLPSALLALGACGAPVTPNAGAQPTSAAETLSLTPESMARLDARVPFTISAIEAVFPGFDVIPVPDPSRGTSYFEIRRPGETAARYRVESDWTRGYVGAVISRDPAVQGPGGAVIGKTQLGELSTAALADCAPGEPGFLVCPDPVSPSSVVRVYRTLGESGAPEPAGLLYELRYLPPVP